jgi:hypothetical protein
VPTPGNGRFTISRAASVKGELEGNMTDSTENTSLDNLLSGTSSAAPAETPVERVKTAPTPQETGDKEASASPVEATEKDDDSPLVPRKALIEERRKRQDYEKKLAEFEAKLTELSKPRPQEPQPPRQMQPPPDPWTDPEGALAYERQQRAMELYETRVTLSEEIMSQKPDYEDAKRAFIEAANADPMLAQKLVRHPMPAKLVYEEGKRMLALKEIGPDPATYREQLRQQLREELLAEMQAQQPSQQPVAPRAPAPKSLAGTTSAVLCDPHGRYAPRSGPASLDDILGG